MAIKHLANKRVGLMMNIYWSKFYTNNFSILAITFLLFSSCQFEEKMVAKEQENNAECQICLDEIVINSDFQFQVNKNKVKVRIDEESSELVKMKVYEDNQDRTTLGWLVYRPQERKLADISNYLDSLPLKVDERWLEKYERCKGISKNRKLGKNQLALN